MPTRTELIDKIRTKIDAVLDADPATMKYKIGSKSVDKTAYLDMLTKALGQLESGPADPDVGLMAFDFDVSEFGEDVGEYVL